MLIDKDLYKRSSKTQKIRCEICANYCKISDGGVGVCGQHKNINGELYDLNYARVSSLSPDPIEKKPLYHYLPGSLTYSIGGLGCNMSCRHCQNHTIAHEYQSIRTVEITPSQIIENAIKLNCKSIAWTYNEPTVHLPFTKITSQMAHEKNLKVIYVTNGYFSHKSLDEVLGFVDAFNIDLKSIREDFNRKICGADVGVVLDNIKRVFDGGKHLEITNLIINDYNDSESEINDLCDFIADNLDLNVPLHFTRAFPHYKMSDIAPTKKETLIMARDIALSKGFKNVHLGNVF